jgi:hypothetical protein
VAGACDGLVVASPPRPGEDEAGRVRIVGAKTAQEAMDLGNADGDEILVCEGGIRVPRLVYLRVGGDGLQPHLRGCLVDRSRCPLPPPGWLEKGMRFAGHPPEE